MLKEGKEHFVLQQVNGIVEADGMHRNLGKSYCIVKAEPVGVFCEGGVRK